MVLFQGRRFLKAVARPSTDSEKVEWHALDSWFHWYSADQVIGSCETSPEIDFDQGQNLQFRLCLVDASMRCMRRCLNHSQLPLYKDGWHVRAQIYICYHILPFFFGYVPSYKHFWATISEFIPHCLTFWSLNSCHLPTLSHIFRSWTQDTLGIVLFEPMEKIGLIWILCFVSPGIFGKTLNCHYNYLGHQSDRVICTYRAR